MDRIGLTFEEYAELKIRPRTGADAEFQTIVAACLQQAALLEQVQLRQDYRCYGVVHGLPPVVHDGVHQRGTLTGRGGPGRRLGLILPWVQAAHSLLNCSSCSAWTIRGSVWRNSAVLTARWKASSDMLTAS